MPGDFDALCELRDVADGAETSTATEAAVALPLAYAGPIEAVVYITAIDAASSDETYTFGIEVDTAAAFSSAVEVASRALTASGGTAAVGEYTIPLGNNEYINSKEAGATHVRIKATLGGTTPSVTYGAYIRPMKSKQANIANRA